MLLAEIYYPPNSQAPEAVRELPLPVIAKNVFCDEAISAVLAGVIASLKNRLRQKTPRNDNFRCSWTRSPAWEFTIPEAPASWFHSAAIKLFQSKKPALFAYCISRRELGNQKINSS
jgi:hypothetical protein